MSRRPFLSFACRLPVAVAVFVGIAPLPVAQADVVVVSNAADRPVKFTIAHRASQRQEHQLAAQRTVAIPTIGRAAIEFNDGRGHWRRMLDANSAHTFDVTSDGQLVLEPIELAGDAGTAEGTGLVTPENYATVVDLPIKILVDDDEPAARRAWQRRLEQRVGVVSDVLEKNCRLRLKIVAFDEWQSNDDLDDFTRSKEEFERLASVSPARLAIGFTSQHRASRLSSAVGCGARPLGSHILIREWSEGLTEPQRVEVLMHELGHFLGASHHDGLSSVMRPLDGDAQARAAGFLIAFDPVNTLATYLVAEELRFGRARSAADFSPKTVARLRQIYSVIGKPLAQPVVELPPPSPGEEPPPPLTLPPPTVAAPQPAPPRPLAEPAQPQPIVARPASDIDKLQGTWVPVTATHGGGLLQGMHSITFTRDRVLVTMTDATVHTLAYQVDSRQPIKRFEISLEMRGRQVVSQGIFRFDGDTLVSCNALPGRPRPREWTSTRENGQALVVFRRAP